MAPRQVLLIDTDPNFADLLRHELTPYNVDVEVVDDGSDGLNRVKQINPELIFIAVDLPDKAGYAICNRAKKGVAKVIPVVLATGTVPPADLEQHRKLKVHADEYIDKRTLTGDELVGKVHQLINLGDSPPEEPQSDFDIPLEEEFLGEEGSVAAEEIDVSEVEFQDDGADIDIPVAQHLDHHDVGHAGRQHGRGGNGSGYEENEATRLSDFLDPGISDETEAAFAAMSMDGSETPFSDERVAIPTITTEITDAASGFEDFEVESPSMLSAPPPLDEVTDLHKMPEAVARVPMDPVVAMPSAASMTIADNDRTVNAQIAYADQISELSTEVERLRGELDKARSKEAEAGKFSREREFLNLREVINKKEKELIELKEEIDVRERSVLGLRERIRELEKTASAAEEKSLTIEGRLVSMSESTAGLEEMRTRLERDLAVARKEAEEARHETERSRTEAQKAMDRARADHEKAMAAAMAGVQQKAEEERKAALEAMRQKAAVELDEGLKAQQTKSDIRMGHLRNEHAQKLEAMRGEQAAAREQLEQFHAANLEELTRNHERALAQADDARQRALADAEQRRERELAAGEEAVQAEIARMQAEHDEAIGAVERRKDSEREQALQAAEDKRNREMEAADIRRQRELEQAEERRQRDLADADARREREQLDLNASHARAIEELTETHSNERAELQGRIARLEDDVRESKKTLGIRDKAIDSYERDVAERDGRIMALREEVGDLEKQGIAYQERLLKAFGRLKSDGAAVDRAKKALAIALTVLDEQVSSEADDDDKPSAS